MRFLHGKAKARKGHTIKVNFSEPTRVLIMTEKNFNKYKNNLTFTYYGGHKEESPFEFSAPKDGTWFVVVEKGTYHEPRNVTADIELHAPAAPEPKPEISVDSMLDDADSSGDEESEEETSEEESND